MESDVATQLLLDIRTAFLPLAQLSKSAPVAYASGDAFSVERIARVLNYRPWHEVTFEEFLECGPDELKDYLSRDAYVYYLPGLLSVIVGNPEIALQSRLHEVVALMILPSADTHADVRSAFGDGLFSHADRSKLSNSSNALLEKIAYARATYDSDQRRCISRYILAAENTSGSSVSSVGDQQLLKKWGEFWFDL